MAEAAKDHITDVVERSGGDNPQVLVTGFQVVYPSRAATTHASRIHAQDYIDRLMITNRKDMDQLKKQMAYVLGEVQNLQSEVQDLKDEIDERLWQFETGVKPLTTKPEFGQPELGSHRQASIAWITRVILKLHYDEQKRRGYPNEGTLRRIEAYVTEFHTRDHRPSFRTFVSAIQTPMALGKKKSKTQQEEDRVHLRGILIHAFEKIFDFSYNFVCIILAHRSIQLLETALSAVLHFKLVTRSKDEYFMASFEEFEERQPMMESCIRICKRIIRDTVALKATASEHPQLSAKEVKSLRIAILNWNNLCRTAQLRDITRRTFSQQCFEKKLCRNPYCGYRHDFVGHVPRKATLSTLCKPKLCKGDRCIYLHDKPLLAE
ncbi:hypothetical protein HRR90_007857 [Exophiala dermatitidis]|nr:hypothetical protein HRR73_007640 [Exophiala dermatitidis]KAJ4540114.1 hypothetical protein HRR76_003531 [Exophiala dermatitidis]KAJ4561632.1 hypothetical protein HRR81_009331 [Exophiala dermatitidis]KAJ4597771.1 hypothetical protein HRR84_004533 [Exophiala dermatitidis]KAJ4613247.1 hypothetical protein HRR88_008373 [Exophiala dermatitidis]